ncbi:MAG: hydroxymethylbilane synthase [Planctomycetes bacterium]|nr:hydroxymethylbilane synthase [Planctomycetota bacterium]MBI3846783.1 hydroxymethylbilane synthase [Planctomycetota bacterium]
MPRELVLGSRASPLARAQTEIVRAAIVARSPDVRIRVVTRTSRGDHDRERPLTEMGGVGVFTKELEDALLAHEIDIAVHSLKDLPTRTAAGLVIAAITAREDVRDALVAAPGVRLASLSGGGRIGTGSPRRKAQLRLAYPRLEIVPIRGNVDTRVARAAAGDLDGVVLALAGLKRTGLAARATDVFPVDLMLPAPGQGALAIETRADDSEATAATSVVDDPGSRFATTAERLLLDRLGGGCNLPLGTLGESSDGREGTLRAVLADPEGRVAARGRASGKSPEAVADAALASLRGDRLDETLAVLRSQGLI